MEVNGVAGGRGGVGFGVGHCVPSVRGGGRGGGGGGGCKIRVPFTASAGEPGAMVVIFFLPALPG
jgi:hypothetical protein